MSFAGKTKLATPAAPKEKTAIKLNRRDNNTSGVSPLVIRITQNERQLLQDWLVELQQHTNKRLTGAKLVRGLIAMRAKINQKALIESIADNT